MHPVFPRSSDWPSQNKEPHCSGVMGRFLSEPLAQEFLFYSGASELLLSEETDFSRSLHCWFLSVCSEWEGSVKEKRGGTEVKWDVPTVSIT